MSVSSPHMQMHTCVWDIHTPFRITLVKGAKVNAEETTKVTPPTIFTCT